MLVSLCFVCFFKRKTAYDVRISDWSSDVCSSDLGRLDRRADAPLLDRGGEDLVAAAEAFDESVRPRLFGESREIGEVDGEAARDAARAGGDEERGEDAVARAHAAEVEGLQIGRASCGEGVCQYVVISVVDGSLKKKKKYCIT